MHHNTPCLPPSPEKLYNHCFQSLLGITVVPREIENNGYATMFFGGGGGVWRGGGCGGEGGKQGAIERFSLDCRKTKTKVNTPANQRA